tara:strand:- start:3176 stop:3325 length:150 start_codon:yes stop_codon:yes gene_type:complete
MEYLAEGDVDVSELEAVKVPEPEPKLENRGKFGYILMGIMGLILSKLKT